MAVQSWTLRMPVPVEFGVDCVAKLPAYLTGHRRVLLLTGRSAMRTAGVTDRLVAMLTAAGMECELFEELSAEPEHAEIEEAGRIAHRFAATALIGCGGGSAIDGAKAAAVAATHEGPIMDYVINGKRQITSATLPVFAVSSTSGTGSHVGKISVISDRARKVKRPLISDFLYPRAAFCDPMILKNMPPSVTANTGFDAFAQALEGYLSRVEHPMGSLCAWEAVRIVHQALPVALERGDDVEARASMAWGDTLAGFSLATNAVVIPHVLSMVLGGRYGIAHGRAIATVMVASLRHSKSGAVAKLARVASLLGCRAQLSDDELAGWAIDAIADFIARIGLKKSLLEYGVPEGEIGSVAAEVRRDFGMRIEADPVPTDTAGLERILRGSFKG